jgi:hypothetical protein
MRGFGSSRAAPQNPLLNHRHLWTSQLRTRVLRHFLGVAADNVVPD